MVLREFWDYIDDSGTNVIAQWLNGFGQRRAGMKAKLDVRLSYIGAASTIRKEWMEKLKGANDGIYEIKLSAWNIEYRILSCYGPEARQITMLFPAIEHNDQLRPPNARQTAGQRRAQIHLAGRVTQHDC
jgi:hypothetical protein